MRIRSDKTKAIINKGVANLTAFQVNGTLTGEKYGTDYPYNGHRAEARGATYVVRSYAEPIAWFKDGEWFETSTRWSNTTAMHKSHVRAAIIKAGHEVTVD